jgi:hypothetical protein
MRIMKNCFLSGLTAIGVCCLLTALACRQQPQSRQYEENGTSAAKMGESGQTQPLPGAWRWEKPLPWQEKVSAGLRLMTFSIADRESSGQCTLVSLPGDGGGIQANVQRWLEQLQLPVFSPQELDGFLRRQKKMQTKDGLPVVVIDFTTLGQPRQRPVMSMLVALVSAENQTLFVKLSGGTELLEKNREAFYKFCLSLSMGA